MDITETKAAIADVEAKLFKGEGVVNLNGDTRIRKWENVTPELLEDAITYLRTYTAEKNGSTAQTYVEDLTVDDTTLDGLWRCGRVYTEREDSGRHSIFQELHKGYVTSLIPSGGSSPSVDWSEFYILSERGFHANHEMPVLRLANVAPSAVHDLVSYLNQDTFTDISYRDDTLSGTWRRVRVEANVQEDGSYTIDVVLTDSANTDLYFRYQADNNTVKGHLFKWDTTEELINDALNTAGFLSAGQKIEFYTDFADDGTAPSGLDGRTYWYNPHVDQLNGENVFYDASDTYACWHDGDDRLITAIADVGGTPENYYRFLEYYNLVDADGNLMFDADGKQIIVTE